MSEVNYKGKYQQLKAKFMSAVDTAFRLGYEQGGQDAQMEQMQQQQQEQAELEAQQAAGIGQDGQPGESEPGNPGQDVNEQSPGMPGQVAQPGQDQNPASAHPDGTELDQHIAKLESMLGKGEVTADDLKKTVDSMKEFKLQIQKSKEQNQFNIEMRKSTEAIPKIAKALHRPAFKLGKVAQHNLNDTDKRAVSMQEKIVSDIFKSWENESKTATKKISEVINVEGLTKKEK